MKLQPSPWFPALALAACGVILGADASAADDTQVTGVQSDQLSRGGLQSANEIIGMDIVNGADEDLGSVTDIILDTDERRIAYAVVSYGGLLGLGDKHFAVPWQAFTFAQEDRLSLDIAPERLKDAPGFEDGALPNTADPMFHQSAHEFYDVGAYQRASSDTDNADSDDDVSAFDWENWSTRDDDNWTRQLSELIGVTVENPKDENIAELEDVLIDVREGRIAYAIVSHGGALGFFSENAAVPWTSLQLNRERGVYDLNATEEQLDSAKIEGWKYHELEDRQRGKSIHSAFQAEPYWDAYGYSTDPATNNDDAMDEKGQQRFTGTVQSVGSYNKSSDRNGGTEQNGVRLRMIGRDGASRTVHLGTREELEQNDCNIVRGDTITVSGSQSDYSGHKVLRATSITKDGKTVELSKNGA